MWLNCLIVLNKGVQMQMEGLAYENMTKCAAAWAPARPGGSGQARGPRAQSGSGSAQPGRAPSSQGAVTGARCPSRASRQALAAPTGGCRLASSQGPESTCVGDCPQDCYGAPPGKCGVQGGNLCQGPETEKSYTLYFALSFLTLVLQKKQNKTCFR